MKSTAGLDWLADGDDLVPDLRSGLSYGGAALDMLCLETW